MSKSAPPPSSRGAAGVPAGGGNGKFIAIGIVLLLLMIALIVFKMTSGSEQPKPTPGPSVVATTPLDSKLDDVPPPPDVAAAEPDAGAKAQVKTNGPDPCAVKSCSGTAGQELESALGMRAKQARRCYEAELKNEPTLKGKIALNVRIGANGTVCAANVTSSELPAISACVERVFRVAGAFPPPRGGCVEATVPMSFVPGR